MVLTNSIGGTVEGDRPSRSSAQARTAAAVSMRVVQAIGYRNVDRRTPRDRRDGPAVPVLTSSWLHLFKRKDRHRIARVWRAESRHPHSCTTCQGKCPPSRRTGILDVGSGEIRGRQTIKD